MINRVNLLAQGYHTVSPYLIIRNAANAIEFYKRAFGANELMRMTLPDGKVGYAEIQIGDSIIMIADEFPDMDTHSPLKFEGSPVRMHLYVNDVDSFISHAVTSGAKITRQIQDQFFGDRSGGIEDPFGHRWSIATRKENVSREEMMKRFKMMIESVPST